MTNEQKAIRTTWFSIASNAALAIIKWIGGYFGNSYALIADAIESTTDLVSSFLVLLGLKYASRPADKNHPYGHGKAEPLITFMVVGFLITSALIIAHESIQNIKTPHEGPKAFTLWILGAIILWKELSYQKVIRKSRETKSTLLKADAWHHRSDAITSVTAFIGISIALVMGEGYESADDWAALAASAFILYNCYRIFRPALGEIMDEHTHDDLIDEIRSIAMHVDGVTGTEKCVVRKVGMRFFIDLHIEVDGDITVRHGHDIAHTLKAKLMNELPEVADVLMHVEPREVSS
ncbi:MAG TPA: cation diffusion facilitator family transporter [Saprospiraceae bacterium]|nr:cation diffusion facilitator family transporter [Saprospiraceae bacterium]